MNTVALTDGGAARLIETVDAATAALLAHDSKLRHYCLRAGDRQLVVPEKHRAAFNRELRARGYIVASASPRA